VSRFQKGKTNLDFTEARDSEWQWHQLGHMQVCTSLQTDSHDSTPPLSFLQAGCPSCRPTNSVKALKAYNPSFYANPSRRIAFPFFFGTDYMDSPLPGLFRSGPPPLNNLTFRPVVGQLYIGGRAFPVAGAKVWNVLPSDVTSASSLSVFKNRLKTYLFRRCYETV